MLQVQQTSSQGQHCEVPEAHPAVAARSKTPVLCPSGCGGNGQPAFGYNKRGRIIAAQEVPASPGALRNGKGSSTSVTVPSPVHEGMGEPQANPPEQLIPKIGETEDYGAVSDREEMVAMTVTTTPRKPTFLQRERWKAVQQAKLRGLSIRGMARELGIHRDTVRRYIDAESPPPRRTPAAPSTPVSDTISGYAMDIFAEHLGGHFPRTATAAMSAIYPPTWHTLTPPITSRPASDWSTSGHWPACRQIRRCRQPHDRHKKQKSW